MIAFLLSLSHPRHYVISSHSFLLDRSSLGAPPPSFCQTLKSAQTSLECEFGGGGGGGGGGGVDLHANARFGFDSMLFLTGSCGATNNTNLQVRRHTSHITHHTSHSTHFTFTVLLISRISTFSWTNLLLLLLLLHNQLQPSIFILLASPCPIANEE